MIFYRWLRLQWDRAAAIVAVGVGAICLLLGYLGISRSVLPTQQIPYLASGGLVGLFLLGMGATLWLSADLRDEWRKLDEVADLVRRDLGSSGPEAEPASTRIERTPKGARAGRVPATAENNGV